MVECIIRPIGIRKTCPGNSPYNSPLLGRSGFKPRAKLKQRILNSRMLNTCIRFDYFGEGGCNLR